MGVPTERRPPTGMVRSGLARVALLVEQAAAATADATNFLPKGTGAAAANGEVAEGVTVILPLPSANGLVAGSLADFLAGWAAFGLPFIDLDAAAPFRARGVNSSSLLSDSLPP